MNNRKNVVLIKHIGLQRLVDMDRATHGITLVCRASDVLVGHVNENAVVQVFQERGRIAPACCRSSRAIEINEIMFGRLHHWAPVINEVSREKAWLRERWL